MHSPRRGERADTLTHTIVKTRMREKAQEGVRVAEREGERVTEKEPKSGQMTGRQTQYDGHMTAAVSWAA